MVAAMATMNFSIPGEVQDAFNKAFEGENKSAVVGEPDAQRPSTSASAAAAQPTS
jgi:hypothetical protein